MLVDTHAHLNFEAFESDWKTITQKCLSQEISVINVGSNYKTSCKAVETAEFFDEGVFAAIGMHPIHAKEETFVKENFEKLAKSKRVVAIGEIGLDRFKDYGFFFEQQEEILLEQLKLAKNLGLPVIIHCRMAHEDLIPILNSHLPIKGVIHCFTGTWEEAQKYLKMGFYLGINGIMYKLDLKEVIEKVPLERLLLETDSPYLGPNKNERNEPLLVKQIAKEIARIKNISFDEVAQATTLNAQTLFGI